jgi:hypothetical protein
MPGCSRTWPLGVLLDLGTRTRLPSVCIQILALLDPIVVASYLYVFLEWIRALLQ